MMEQMGLKRSTKWSGYQAQHIIPSEMTNNPVIEKIGMNFDAPIAILENKTCDFGTGLLMFHYADGYRLLESSDEVSSSSLEKWKDFLSKIYNKLINLEFKSQNISFDPGLTKIQKYKLKKITQTFLIFSLVNPQAK